MEDWIAALKNEGQVYMYGEHADSGVIYFYLLLKIDALDFGGFVSDSPNGIAYGKPLISCRQLQKIKSKGILITDRESGVFPDNITLLRLSKNDIKRVREDYAKLAMMLIKRECTPILFYGAGEYATAFYRCVSPYVRVKSMLISAEVVEEKSLMGVPVVSVNDAEFPDNTLVLVVTDERKHSQIVNTLCEKGYCHYLILSTEMAIIEYRQFITPFFAREDCQYKLLDLYCGTAEFYIAKKNIEMHNQIPHWRLRTNSIVFWEKTTEFLKTTDLRIYYENYYGVFRKKGNKTKSTSTFKLFMAVSIYDVGIDKSIFPAYLNPVHAGAALCDNYIAEFHDDEGDNISKENIFYSEMSVFYWIWKKVARTLSQDAFLGLCHYRRHFDMNEYDIEELAESDIDIVLTCPEINVNGNTNYYLANGAIKKDVADILFKIISENSSEYTDSLRLISEGCMLHPFNMCIMRRKWLDRYASWLFGVCEELHLRCCERGLTEKRYLGYITEILLSVFCAKHKDEARIAIVDRVMIQ